MFEVIGLGRVKGIVGATLLIPLFSARTSNHTYVHELGPLYTIQRFRRCNTEYFDIIPYHIGGGFTEGSAGLMAFQSDDQKIFIGSRAELIRRWADLVEIIREGDLLHAILVEIISENAVAKFVAWRAYVKKSYGNKGSASEIARSKLAHLQRIKEFWEGIEKEQYQEEDDKDKQFKELLKLNRESLKMYLRDPTEYKNRVWRRIWQYADRAFLDSSELREIIMGYIQYCNDEFPEVPQGSWSREIRRAMMFEQANDNDLAVLREFFGTCLPSLKRSWIEPRAFKHYVERLYRHETKMLVADLLGMIDKLTEYVAATEDWEEKIDLGVIGAIFTLLREHMADGHFTKEDIKILI